MTKCDLSFPLPLPDDPRKWQGWSNYNSPNPYDRLCLDPRANPSNELIEEHCRELMRWWQKKLPLKNQPSNPLAQLLRAGLEESSRYLTEARLELLDPDRRKVLDEELAAEVHEAAAAEFRKYLEFALASGVLNKEEEKNLLRFGAERALTEAEMNSIIEESLHEHGAKRQEIAAPPPLTANLVQTAATKAPANPQDEFLRMLRLSNLDSFSMSDDQRDTFIDMAENLGLDPGEAEDLVDLFLEEADEKSMAAPANPAPKVESKSSTTPAAAPVEPKPLAPKIDNNPDLERSHFANFTNTLGGTMIFVPSAEFMMGSEIEEASPNERPVHSVSLSRFYISRCLITNAEYEQFDRAHKTKRAAGAGDRHPAVYVSYLDAVKFCQWLSTRERRKYRLPTEAEWEYAARGTDQRKFPWGNHEGRGDLANFADKNTVFAWSDREIDDGYPESSPVGSFPLGASPFGIEDMAGNVWEWCFDYYELYRTGPKTNPRGATSGTKRVHRGGSWKSRFSSLRATVRSSNVPGFSCNDLGFRIVCECD
ncbi:MAG TPA: SUMF1/EgtB/PvdO family nonheme iron enzyme [Chthoniobacterales bacterium]|jgi:formylglycine-generating enzyme required for sulfatase activity|nr:SUMF1/EgtB/PvdO family nonheme iron enzyme [Chthoniobacterales bacterium]